MVLDIYGDKTSLGNIGGLRDIGDGYAIGIVVSVLTNGVYLVHCGDDEVGVVRMLIHGYRITKPLVVGSYVIVNTNNINTEEGESFVEFVSILDPSYGEVLKLWQGGQPVVADIICRIASGLLLDCGINFIYKPTLGGHFTPENILARKHEAVALVYIRHINLATRTAFGDIHSIKHMGYKRRSTIHVGDVITVVISHVTSAKAYFVYSGHSGEVWVGSYATSHSTMFELLSVGETICGTVVDIDSEGHISLDCVDAGNQCRQIFIDSHYVDEIVTGRIKAINKDGIFVTVARNTEGIIYLDSEVSRYISDVGLKPGDEVYCRIVKLGGGRIVLRFSGVNGLV